MRNFSDSAGEEKHRGPSEEERQTVRRAIAASKARVASRRASRVSHSDHEGTSPTSVRDRLRSNESSGRTYLSLDDVISPPYPEGPRTIPSKNSSKDSGLYLDDRSVEKSTQERVRRGAAGGLCDPNFLRLIKPLYDLHMGAENLGPMLYNLVRFTKPARILEVGAGYTSAFLLHALRDNAVELETYRDLRRVGLAVCGDAPWSVDAFFDREEGDGGGRYRGDDGTMVGRETLARRAPGPADPTRSTSSSDSERARRSLDERRLSLDDRLETRDAPAPAPAPGSEDARVHSGVLHCIDNMAHEHTTAHAVVETARKMRCADRLRLHEADAFDVDLPSVLEPGVEFYMLWIDLGAAHRIEGVHGGVVASRARGGGHGDRAQHADEPALTRVARENARARARSNAVQRVRALRDDVVAGAAQDVPKLHHHVPEKRRRVREVRRARAHQVPVRFKVLGEKKHVRFVQSVVSSSLFLLFSTSHCRLLRTVFFS